MNTIEHIRIAQGYRTNIDFNITLYDYGTLVNTSQTLKQHQFSIKIFSLKYYTLQAKQIKQ